MNVIGPVEVTISAPFVPIERDSPALRTLIDQRQVSGLPLDGRNFLELALLTPGTAQAPQGSAASVRGDFAFSVNGAREDFNNYLLDGVYNVDPKLSTPGVRPPVDAIREFEVATSSYDASFGRNGAGQVNVITRSGTNRIEGTAYEFFRNGANTTVNNQQVGLPVLTSNSRDTGLSLVSVAGFSPLGHEYNNPQASTSDTFQLSDSVTWARGAHLAKVGIDWYGVRQVAFRDMQARGFLTFVDQAFTSNALADLLFGLPALTGGARLDNPQQLRSQAFGFFAHDDWRATPSLTISAGLRYDYMSPPVDADDRANLYDQATGQLVAVGTSGIPRGGYQPDRNNFAPRAGFAWAMDDARTVARGGYGIYYNQGALATSEGLYFNPPYFNLSVFFPFTGLPPLTLADPFPAFFPIPIPQSATAYQRDLQTPWMEHWNVGVQRQLGGSRAVEISYVGSRGHELVSARDLNQKIPSANRSSLRPNPQFADITLIESRGSSRYNALQLKFQQRTTRGLSLLGAYTLGKSTDDASGFFTSAGDPNFPQDSANPGAERGRSSFDVRHRLSVSFSYALPSRPGNVWLEGWELHGIVTLQSGRPFTIALRPDIDQSNTDRSNLGFGYNDRPNVNGDPSLSDPDSDAWFNIAAFSLPAFGTFGNAGRNILDGPGYQNVNLGIAKTLPVGNRVRLQLRAEAFNLFDRVNFDLPDAFFGSSTFGRILSAQNPRRIQFGAKMIF
ncbi:MAG: TonB-dependent receptor [Acidobacteria bacterium]|nr:TonB-dependent receptor [Acidobacteriota bacterium]MCA1650944.1 TonB-dependent receptor [Acidobacteriota bacterium]